MPRYALAIAGATARCCGESQGPGTRADDVSGPYCGRTRMATDVLLPRPRPRELSYPFPSFSRRAAPLYGRVALRDSVRGKRAAHENTKGLAKGRGRSR